LANLLHDAELSTSQLSGNSFTLVTNYVHGVGLVNILKIAFTSIAFPAFLAGCVTTDGGPLSLSNFTDPFTTKVPFFVHALSRDAAAHTNLYIHRSPDMRNFARVVEENLVALSIHEAKYYQNIAVTPDSLAYPDTAAVDLARKSGATAALLIQSGQRNIEVKNSTKSRASCAVDTKFFKSCPKGSMINTTVSCYTKIATFRAPIRLLDAKTARLIYSYVAPGSYTQTYCSDENNAQESDDSMISFAVGNAAALIAKAIAPSEELRPLDLMARDANLKPAAIPEFDRAVAFAKAKRLDKACAIFDDIYRDASDSKSLAYNMGYCAESRGEMIKANDLYETSSQLSGGPDSQIDKRQIALRKFIQENPAVLLATNGTAASAANSNASTRSDKVIGAKIALVIGNAQYEKRGSWLANPVNDARLMDSQLRRMGFNVTKVENARSKNFQNLIAEFSTKAKNAAVAVVFYSGHGVQLEGENYLMPVDNEKIRTAEDLKDASLSLGTIIGSLESANVGLKIVILDACRDNPFDTDGKKSGKSNGLAAPKLPPRGALVAYSAKPGSTAEDNQSSNNSLYTRLLVDSLKEDVPVEQVFKSVREKMRAAGVKQIPTEVSSIAGNFSLTAK
jgi:Caspase domain